MISGGYNVYPKEIESEIDGLEGILESAVIGIPHPDFGEGVTAVCVRKPGATISADTIIQVLGKTLAKSQVQYFGGCLVAVDIEARTPPEHQTAQIIDAVRMVGVIVGIEHAIKRGEPRR